MFDLQTITIILIIAGGIIIITSAIYINQLIKLLKRNRQRILTYILFGLILFFSISYFVAAAIIAAGHASTIYTVTGIIFFMGALFVYFTVWTGKHIIEDLLTTTVSRNYVEKIIKSMADTLIVINADENSTIRTVNDATLNLLEYENNDLVGNPINQILSTDILDNIKPDKLTDESNVKSIETIYKTKSGEEIPVSLSVTTLKSRKGLTYGALYVARDIRQQREAERKIKEYVKQLKQLNASKDRFFSIIAHDLRNPFTAVLGCADILAKDAEKMDGKEIKGFSADLYKQSKSIYDLLENLLEWSRIQTGSMKYNPSNMNLCAFINELTGIYNSLLNQKKISLNVNCNTEIKVFADENMLSTVFRNLTSNAIKFTKEEGSIFIGAKELDDKFIEVSVKDTGIGIPVDAQEKLFKIDEHLSTKGTNNEEGTGLGLILCKDLVNKNGGEIYLESEPGEGTNFKFTIPKAN